MFNRVTFFVLFFQTIATAQSIAVGYNHSLVICGDKNIEAWGYNHHGQLGYSTTYDVGPLPSQTVGISDVVSVSGGMNHSLALKTDSTVWAWGNNADGELGIGTYISSGTPVQISTLAKVTSIAAGGWEHSLALRIDGTVWVWGNDAIGQFSDGSNSNSNVPVQKASLGNVIAIAGGEYHSIALKSDGTVWTWGRNYSGQLGDGTNIDNNTPVQVSALSGVIAIAGEGIALKSDGTVWAWGENSNGQLGNGTNTDSNIPLQVSGLSGIVAISNHIALRNDGTVWSWGLNVSGQLGNGSNINSNVPVQVTTLTNISAIASSSEHCLALKNDGTLWTWGENNTGQLGNGTNVDSNLPIQVTGLCSLSTTTTTIMDQMYSNPMEFAIFPNPSIAIVTISFNHFIGNCYLKVTNMLGREIYSKEFKIVSKEHYEQIDLNEFSKGTYFVELSNGSERKIQKLIIQ